MINWTQEAIEAAKDILRADIKDSAWNTDDEVRAALDAAVEAQGVTYRADAEASFEAGRLQGRADALAEAAHLCDAADKSMHPSDIADAIRALKEKQG